MASYMVKSSLLVAIGAGCFTVSADAQVEAAANRGRSVDFSKIKAMTAPSLRQIQVLEQKVANAPATEVAPELNVSATPSTADAEIATETEQGKLYRVELKPGEETAIANQLASQGSLQAQGASLVTLPDVFRQLAVDGTEIQLKPFVIPQRLSFNATLGKFVGSIKIGLHEIGSPAPRRNLSAPISFEVLESELANPAALSIDHSGFPLTSVQISSFNAPDGLKVTVASPFNPNGVPVELALAPTFAIGINRSIEGLGLEETTVSVFARGLDDVLGRTVQLVLNGPAKLESQVLTLDKDGNATTKIRSVGAGSAKVTATLAGFKPVEATVALTMPYLTFASSALGGLVGGLIRLLPGLRRASGSRFLLGLTVALLVGIVVFGLYAVGVNVLPFNFTVQQGAVFVLVVSAMGAFFGSGILGAPPRVHLPAPPAQEATPTTPNEDEEPTQP